MKKRTRNSSFSRRKRQSNHLPSWVKRKLNVVLGEKGLAERVVNLL